MSESIKITKDVAKELQSAIQMKMEELEEYGVFIEAKGMYFDDNSFWITIQGQTDKNAEFNIKAKREFLR